MTSLEKDVFYLTANSRDYRAGIARINLQEITKNRAALDRGKWFVQVEYIYFNNNPTERFHGHLYSPEVVDSKEDKIPLAIIHKRATVKEYIFAPGDSYSRRFFHRINYLRDTLTLELIVNHNPDNAPPPYVAGQVVPVNFEICVSIHIPHGSRHR
jgi:hypothetical protein